MLPSSAPAIQAALNSLSEVGFGATSTPRRRSTRHPPASAARPSRSRRSSGCVALRGRCRPTLEILASSRTARHSASGSSACAGPRSRCDGAVLVASSTACSRSLAWMSSAIAQRTVRVPDNPALSRSATGIRHRRPRRTILRSARTCSSRKSTLTPSARAASDRDSASLGTSCVADGFVRDAVNVRGRRASEAVARASRRLGSRGCEAGSLPAR